MQKPLLFFTLLLIALNSLWLVTANAAPDTSYYYRLSNDFLGTGRSLDVASTGTNAPFMATSSTASGQYWQLTPLTNGYYRLTTKYSGSARSLDTDSTGKPFMGNSGNYSGQLWQLTLLSNGAYRLFNSYLGTGRSLDTYSNNGNAPFMGNTGNYSGQLWRLTPLTKITTTPTDIISQKYTLYNLSGFTVYVEKTALSAHNADTQTAINLLQTKLTEISNFNLKASIVSKLKSVRIFMDWSIDPSGAMRYDPSKDWLVANGQPAEKEKSVAITNISNFIAWTKLNQPYMVWHELAHAYHHQALGWTYAPIVNAYNTAMSKKLYANVSYNPGGGLPTYYRRAYAATNYMEYFSEISEAFFGRNDFYPFIKTDLQRYDTAGYNVATSIWQPR